MESMDLHWKTPERVLQWWKLDHQEKILKVCNTFSNIRNKIAETCDMSVAKYFL